MFSTSSRVRRIGRRIALVVVVLVLPSVGRAQHMLVPMDDRQANHLKAYGLTYAALKAGLKAEWLLNYRGGSFLLPTDPALQRKAALDGVSVESVSAAQVAAISARTWKRCRWRRRRRSRFTRRPSRRRGTTR
jgi:hypothetical protein